MHSTYCLLAVSNRPAADLSLVSSFSSLSIALTPCLCARVPLLLQVQYKYGVETHNLLKEMGADVTFKTYNGMAHSVSEEALGGDCPKDQVMQV